MRALLLAFSLLAANAWIPAAIAATQLTLATALGPAGSQYWYINSPGTYELATPGTTFSTNAEYVVMIQSDNVTLDGMGKTITGGGPPASPSGANTYGVRVNAGGTANISTVVIKNLNVQNKYYGVLFEGVDSGRIESVNASNTRDGITLWRSKNNLITGNTTSSNLNAGIVCDANGVVTSGNNFSNNTSNGNTQFGIMLWMSGCNNSVVSNNTANSNNNAGIAVGGLTGNYSHTNLLSGNTTNGNPVGIFLSGSNNNQIVNNTSSNNSSMGIFLQSSSINLIEKNSVNANGDRGLSLTASTSNQIRENRIELNQNWGIRIENQSNSQLIYNNFFNNVNNTGFAGSNTANKWNQVLSAGPNIVGGPNIGGNYWATPTNTGFSNTCSDLNNNGFCDSAYGLPSGDIDALPLVIVPIIRPPGPPPPPSLGKYYPLTPCRILDSRAMGGPLPVEIPRKYWVWGSDTEIQSQGGTGNCSVPSTARAVVINLTSTEAVANGHFRIYPFGNPLTSASIVNFSNGVTMANATEVPICQPSCDADINIYSSVVSHVVADVMGYFE
jgi:parallel beta-helix repeat protein